LHEIEAGIRLANYQFLVRQRFFPAEGENQAALVEDKIRKYLKRVKKVLKRTVQTRMQRFGGWLFNCAVKSMTESGEIAEVIEKASSGQSAHYLMWVG
jgi:hypothetical protein